MTPVNLNLLKDIRSARSSLNPGAVRDIAEQPLTTGLAASSDAAFSTLAALLGGGHEIRRISEAGPHDGIDLVLYQEGLVAPNDAFAFSAADPAASIEAILDARSDLEVPLARRFRAFRDPVVERIIQRTARENAIFALITALPNVLPNFLELPWIVGEFASDTAFLTINQIRMAFLIAACHNKPVGYAEQKLEIAGLVAGAVGWRALARELMGKIPLGGGLIPKAAIAFAGSYVVGTGLDRLHRTGTRFDRHERRAAYAAALHKGKQVVTGIASGFKKRNAA
jgi:hypothetical protein